jgi:hypothetical protein
MPTETEGPDLDAVCTQLQTYGAILKSPKLDDARRALTLLAISDFMFQVAETVAGQQARLQEEIVSKLQTEVQASG